MAADATQTHQEEELDVDELLVQRLMRQGVHRGHPSTPRFDKSVLTRWHAAAAAEYEAVLDESPCAPRFYKAVELWRAPQPLDRLHEMEVSDLHEADGAGGAVFAQHLRGALYGRLCVRAFRTGGVHTVLEDRRGRAVPLVVLNAAAAAWAFPMGMEVAVKQPCVMTVTHTDGCVGVVAENPADVVDLAAMAMAATRVGGSAWASGASAASTALGCSDLIGPVEIRVGRDAHNRGRRGLFAARDIAAGEVILRTRPLAVSRSRQDLRGGNMWGLVMTNPPAATPSSTMEEECPGPGPDPSPDRLVDRLIHPTVGGLVSTLLHLAHTHPRCAHQLHSLAVAGDSASPAVPPLALFDPSSSSPSYYYEQPLSLDASRLRQAVLTNAFVAPGGGHKGLGLWPLPAFLNHDCDPNCAVGYDPASGTGEVQLVRATADVPGGRELTMPYFDTYRTWWYRRRKAAGSFTWRFACRCPRCAFEEGLADAVPRFEDLGRRWHRLLEAHLFDSDMDGIGADGGAEMAAVGAAPPPPMDDDAGEVAERLRREVERLVSVDPRCARMSAEEREWVRRSFSRSPVASAAPAAAAAAVRAYSSSSSRWSGVRVGGGVRGRRVSLAGGGARSVWQSWCFSWFKLCPPEVLIW